MNCLSSNHPLSFNSTCPSANLSPVWNLTDYPQDSVARTPYLAEDAEEILINKVEKSQCGLSIVATQNYSHYIGFRFRMMKNKTSYNFFLKYFQRKSYSIEFANFGFASK